MFSIKLYCPYCGEEFKVEPPSEKEYGHPPKQVYCLPYTRDIGKFDPKPDDGILSSDCWSDNRIGKDYLSFINFERFGILRVTEKGINVKYRVQKCIECQNLFDVFANYTSGKTLEQIWPHLFSSDPINGGIKLYKGENLSVRLVRSLGKRLNSNFVGAFIFSLVIFLMGWLPYFFLSPSGLLNFRLSKFMDTLLGASSAINPLISDLNLYEKTNVLTISTFILYFSISAGIMLLLLYFENYLSYLQSSSDFDELFAVKEPKIGLNFWKNYISSRFVGVQQQNSFLPQLTQSDIFAGGISLGLALLSWFITPSNKLFESFASRNFYLAIFSISELFIWSFIIYFLSIAIFLSLSLSSYVLNGIRKIPMNLTPYDNFSLSKPLRVLESYSVNIMLVSFVIILLILSISQMIIEIHWVLVWFELALALLFIAVGLGSNRNEYIVGAILYLLIMFGLENATRDIASLGIQIEKGVVSTSLQIPIVDLRILVLGFFLTSAMAFQLYSADQYVNNLLLSAKKSAIRIQRKQLEILQENLDLLNKSILQLNEKIYKQASNTITNRLINEYQAQRFSVLSSIDAAIKVIDHLEKIEFKKNPFGKVTKVLTPLVTSLLFPIIEKAIFDFIFSTPTT